MKSHSKKLAQRIADWEAMKADSFLYGGRVKMVRGYGYRKPGSQKK